MFFIHIDICCSGEKSNNMPFPSGNSLRYISPVSFSLSVVAISTEKTTGLMYRKELPDGKGMLFDFSPERQISMWMKNTYISLDMIFIRADGRILSIAENTEPQSTKIISSGGLAKGVLEVIAGTAKKYGIAPGDRVAHPLFNGR